MKPLLLSIDFDDCIARIGNFPEILGEVPGAIAGLKQLHADGHRIQIWTCRHDEGLDHAKAWLDEKEVPYERINENCPIRINKWGDTRKMGADLYIDDKMLGGLPPWPEIVSLVGGHAYKIYDDLQRVKFSSLPHIIGLSGKRGSGKDTVANIITKLAPWGFFSNASFAHQLKQFAIQLTGHSDVYSQEGKAVMLPDWGMTVGELLQRLGTDAIRNGLHQDAWVLACFAGMSPKKHYIITDCRFPNEMAAIQGRGGIVLRVEGDPLKQQGDGTRDDTHPSETALDGHADFDGIIHNDGSLGTLRERVMGALSFSYKQQG